jgi:hypothetical protein
MILYPAAVYKAFIRGRFTQNLYQNRYTSKEASSFYPDNLAKELNLHQEKFSPTLADKMMFLAWGTMALLFSFISFIVPWIFLFFIISRYN